MSSLQAYIDQEIDDILSKCTGCGVCAEVCPSLPYTAAQGVESRKVVAGVLTVLRGEQGSRVAAEWIEACAGSGVCVTACPEPVNPRRMMLFARNAIKRVEVRDAEK